jgi:hypothetical protein
VENTLTYPHAGTIQWEVPVKSTGEKMDVYWYEGGIKPFTPKAVRDKSRELPDEGVMFVGERGLIMADYAYRDPEIFGVKDSDAIMKSSGKKKIEIKDQTTEMIEYFRGGKVSRGNYLNCGDLAEAICLGNLALRMDRRLEWDRDSQTVTNLAEANEFVARKCRKGWELKDN